MHDHEQELEKHAQDKYNAINARWLKFHLSVTIGSVIAIFCVEFIMLLVLYYTGNMDCSVPMFLLKYIAVPSLCNGMILLISCFTYNSKSISARTKQFVVSVLLTILCFMLSFIHSVFVVVLAAAVCPIILTVMYENRILTGVTAACSFVLQLISGYIVCWDPAKVRDEMYMFNVIVLLAVLVCVWLISHLMIRFMEMKRKIVIQNDIERYLLRREVVTDMLTNVGNKLALEKSLAKIAVDPSSIYYLAMLDVDHFKQINDNYGHVMGDIVLQCIGKALKNIHVKSDAFRFGGDEFCILFTDCGMESILESLKQVQDAVNCCIMEQTGQSVSVSIGVAKYCSGFSVFQLIHFADEAMYRSKRKEDNSITVYETN